MTVGSVQNMSHMQNRKPVASHIFMSTLFRVHKRKMIQEYNV